MATILRIVLEFEAFVGLPVTVIVERIAAFEHRRDLTRALPPVPLGAGLNAARTLSDFFGIIGAVVARPRQHFVDLAIAVVVEAIADFHCLDALDTCATDAGALAADVDTNPTFLLAAEYGILFASPAALEAGIGGHATGTPLFVFAVLAN